MAKQGQDLHDKKCVECGEYYSQTEINDDYPKITQDMHLCAHCLEENENVTRCYVCDEYILLSQGIGIEERIICPECKNDNTLKCDVCGGLAIKERRSPKRIIDGLCEDCETKQLYYNHISDLKLESAVIHSIGFAQVKIMKTTNLMSRLHPYHKTSQKSDDDSPFDALLIDMWQIYRRRILSYGFYLVIVYGIPSRCYSLSKDSCTMTELTKSRVSLWDSINKERSKESITWSDGRVFNLWDCPYNLRAMTNYDMDYRKEFVYGELRYEGNNYGDTSDFYIIGSIKK